MKKVLGIVLAITLFLSFTLPVNAGSLSYSGVDVNFDAGDNDDALVVRWSTRPWSILKGEDFKLGKKETTLEEVEQRCTLKFFDLIKEDVKMIQVDPEDEVHQGILSPNEEIVYLAPQEYLRTWQCYFALRINSLDNPETPENELNFTPMLGTCQAFDGYADFLPDEWNDWN